MTKRFFSIAMMMVATHLVALESHAQGAQRDVVNTWTFTWSDETQKALSLTTTWRKDNSNVCFYEVATNNEQIKINNEDIIPGLTFTASKSNIGLRSSGLHLAGNSSTRIHLASLSAGNIVKITSSGGSSSTAQYIEPESVSDETIKVKEAVDGTNTKSQTYSFEVVAENSYNFKLNGSASLQIQKMEVYENADASNPIEGKSWDFQSLYSTQFTETVLACLPINQSTDGMRWSYNSAPRYEIGSTLESTGPLKVWLSPISETNGLTFTTTATGKIRIMLESPNSLMLINNSGVTVTIPSVPAGGRVTIKTHVASRVTDNSGNAPSSTENSGKDYIFDIASAGDFTFKITGDVKIYSICVEGPETTATALTPENVSVASVTYNGSEQTAVVKYNSETLTRGTDYTVTGTDALTNAGNTTFTIAGAGNFTGMVSDLTFTITPKEVTVTGGITANNKVYDGNTTATLVLTGATIDGKVGEDELIVSSATGSFADANVSENKDVTISDITLGGVKAGNYTLSATGNQTTTTATITQATNALIGTLAIEGWTYGTTANLPSGVSATFGEVVYKYSNAENGEYGTYDDIVNGVVGTWWVKAFVEGTDNYTAAESSPVSFTISSVATTISVTAQDYSGTYDGAAHGISVTAEEGATISYRETESGDYTLTENPTYTNVGSYIVYYKVTKDNCEDVTGSKTVTINPAAGSINAFSPASGSVAMGTTGFVVTTTATGDGTITYSSSDESVATINTTTGAVTPVAAGTTTITATVTNKDGGNYTYAAESNTATYELTVTTSEPVTYTVTKGSESHCEFTVEPVGDNVTEGATITVNVTSVDAGYYVNYIGYEYYDETQSRNRTVKEKEYTERTETITETFAMPALNITVKVGTAKHTHNFSYEIGTGDNSNVLTATCSANGCGLSGKSATLTLTANGGIYSGSAFAATTDLDAFNTATGLSATCSITYTGDNENYTTEAPTNVGNYTAKATITIGETPYILTKTFAISQQSLTIAAKAQTITVGGNIATGVDQVTADGLVSGDELTEITLESSSTAAITTEGTITPSAAQINNGAGNANYNINYVNGNLTITKAQTTTYTLNFSSANESMGSVSVNPTATDNKYEHGAEVTITATAEDGYEFDYWTVDNNKDTEHTTTTLTVTMTADKTVVATFKEKVMEPTNEEYVDKATTWIFNTQADGEITTRKVIDKLYARVVSGRSYTFENLETVQSFTFSDGKSVSIEKVATGTGSIGYGLKIKTANDSPTGSSNDMTPSFAFNTTVKGTCYALLQETGTTHNTSYRQRIYYGNGTDVITSMISSEGAKALGVEEIKWSSDAAGTFVVGSTTALSKIYAIRFVPTRSISIGSTSNGTVIADKSEAGEGQTITLAVTPNNGYELESLKANDTDVTTKTTDGKYTFAMPDADVTITATFVSNVHTHNFSYEVGSGDNTNVLTATCQTAGCDLTGSKATLTLTANGGTYNGSPFAATTDLDAFNQTTGLSATCSINYTGDSEYNSSNAPKNVGSYTATATVTIGETNYTLTKTFTISAASVTTYSITLPTTVNGNSVTANVDNLSSVVAGTEVTLTITTTENYMLTSISATGVTLSGNSNIRTFTMPSSNVTITANWEAKTAESAKTEVTENVDVVDASHATVTSVEVGNETTTITISGTVSNGTNDVPVTTIAEGTFTADNTANVQSIDLSSTQVSLSGERSSNSVLKDIPENTLVYLPSTSNGVTGDNVIIYDGDGTEASDYTCNNFVMTDKKSYSVPKTFTATNATLSRSFTNGVTCTVCLPYNVPAGNLDGKIYQFSEVDGATVKMTEKTGGLVANTPYIFVPSSNATQITASTVTINMSDTPNTSPDGQSFTFKGIFEHKDFTTDEISGGIYGFAADADHGASVGQFVKASNGAWTEGMRAYLAYSGNLSETGVATTRGEGLPEYLNVVLVSASGNTTNIGRLELMTAEDGSPVYNLNGQRVDSSYKGLVIKNGKKVVKK